MKVLVADDDILSRCMLESALREWGYEPMSVGDGMAAWEVLQGADTPRLAILDWMMPGMDGTAVCRRLREQAVGEPVYAILLTGRDAKADVVVGLEAGANDYVTKPFDREELRARVRVGKTVVELQASLAGRIRDLEDALGQVKQLQGLLPICSYCRRVRDDHSYWQQVEQYVARHSGVQFSHGICPDCYRDLIQPQLRAAGIPPLDEKK